MSNRPLLLASRSPRRRELLDRLGVTYIVRPADIDETAAAGESADDYVRRLARQKALLVYGQDPAVAGALAADTTVTLDGRLYGKPADRAEGLAMLRALSGRTHRVLTAVTLAHAGGVDSELSASEVTFAPLDERTIESYWESGEPLDKAGSYAVQGLAAAFIQELKGSYTGIMGLPLYETAALLSRGGIPHALSGAAT